MSIVEPVSHKCDNAKCIYPCPLPTSSSTVRLLQKPEMDPSEIVDVVSEHTFNAINNNNNYTIENKDVIIKQLQSGQAPPPLPKKTVAPYQVLK